MAGQNVRSDVLNYQSQITNYKFLGALCVLCG